MQAKRVHALLCSLKMLSPLFLLLRVDVGVLYGACCAGRIVLAKGHDPLARVLGSKVCPAPPIACAWFSQTARHKGSGGAALRHISMSSATTSASATCRRALRDQRDLWALVAGHARARVLR